MIILSVVLLTALISAPCFSQVGVSSIKGYVTEFGLTKPIKGAKIKYKPADSNDYTWGVTTDEKGYFTTPNRFPDGMIVKLVVSAEGYQQEYEEVITNEREAVEVNVSLKKSSETGMKLIRKDFVIQHRDPVEIFKLVEPYVSRTLRPVFSEKLRTISVQGTPEQIALINEMIQNYDTPLKQIWLEVFLIQASGDGKSPHEYPKEIKDIVNKMQTLFKFEKYEIVGRADAMGLEGTQLTFGTLQRVEKEFEYSFNAEAKLGYSNGIIRLENLRVIVMEPIRSSLSTSVNIQNGETLILGASRGDAQKGSLITVVTAKVME
jgi:hypothetical protein